MAESREQSPSNVWDSLRCTKEHSRHRTVFRLIRIEHSVGAQAEPKVTVRTRALTGM